MSGALLALAGASGAGGSSGTPGAVTWSNIFCQGGGSTNSQTLSGITGALTITAANSGASALYYQLNGVSTAYAGAFAWPEGQTLNWSVSGVGSGTVSVTYRGGVALTSFTYVVKNAGGFL